MCRGFPRLGSFRITSKTETDSRPRTPSTDRLIRANLLQQEVPDFIVKQPRGRTGAGLGVELLLVVNAALDLPGTESVEDRTDAVEEWAGFLAVLTARVNDLN